MPLAFEFFWALSIVTAARGKMRHALPERRNCKMTFLKHVFLCVVLGAAPTSAQQAEPQVPTGKFTTAVEVKPILSATKGNWVGVREWEGQDLVYVTHIWAWRCGLVRLEVSLNSAAFEDWPLPPCHLDQAAPNAILDGDGLPFRAFGLNSVIEVAVRVTYDDLTMDEARFPRSAIRIP